MNKLKQFYLHTYQQTAYEISITRSEYDKIFSFASITLQAIIVLKLFLHTLPFWILPLLFLVATISAKWMGKWLIALGVPKKTAQLGNMNNPELMRILEILEKSYPPFDL